MPLFFLLAILPGIANAQQNPPPDQNTRSEGVVKRGEHVMGFSHEATTHHFGLFKDGGEIVVTAKDPNDKASIEQIRTHLGHIAKMFSSEIPLTPLAIEAFKSQMLISGIGPFLFPSDKNPSGHHKNLKTAWRKTLKRAGVPYFRIYDLRSTYATRLSAGGVADEWVSQLLRQGDAKVFKKYSQMKLQMKREALEKMNRQSNEMPQDSGTVTIQ